MQIFSYKDIRAEAGQPVFPSINASTAIRETEEHIRQGRIPLSYASDYALYLLAEFDPTTMRVTPLEDPKHIIDVVEIVKEIEKHGE